MIRSLSKEQRQMDLSLSFTFLLNCCQTQLGLGHMEIIMPIETLKRGIQTGIYWAPSRPVFAHTP